MQIGIIGLGLIGGSIGLELNAQLATKVYGWDVKEEHRKMALELNLVEAILTEKQILDTCDFIIIATPVHLIEKKGTEFSGPTAAHRGLFNKKKNIICDREFSKAEFVESTIALFNSMGMQTIFLNSMEHDKHLAYVSHLSHISSFMLGHTVLDLEKDEKQIFNLASTGFASTVRLAKSSPNTWNPIFSGNKEYVLEALESYITHLENFAQKLRNNDLAGTYALMEKANEIKPVLDGITTNNKN